MTDLLARIPFSENSDFSALALAPGLPMLDGRKLAYQVLLGWFGDMLAEPELDDEGVSFHVQSRGQRVQIAEHALATQHDLDGHLAGDYDRLKKALFDVRPVSPSERLIFNRLEPPIVNHEGFLYRVRPVGSSDRLVWCWGFQRRRSTGHAMLCPHDDCSVLFIRQDTSIDTCPRCGRALFQQTRIERRTTFPTGAVAATVMLSGLVGATYWIASVSGDEAIDPLPALAAVSPPELEDVADTDDPHLLDQTIAATDERETSARTAESPTAADSATITRPDAAASETVAADSGSPRLPETSAVTNDDPAPAERDLTELPPFQSPSRDDGVQPEYGNSPLRPFAANTEPRRLDLLPDVNSADEPQLVDRVAPQEKNGRPASPPPAQPAPSKPALPRQATSTPVVREPRPMPQPPALPERATPGRPDSQPTQPSTEQPSADTAPKRGANTARPSKPSKRPVETTVTVDPPPVAKSPVTSKPTESRPAAESPASPAGTATTPAAPETPPADAAPASGWSSDYIAAYQQAIAEHRYLIMLFRDPSGPAADSVSLENLPSASELDRLSDAVRVVVPTTMPVPGQAAETAPRLLDHRSFRHLQGEAGIAVVDLTSTDSSHFGRVVSAFPGATDTRSIVAALKPAQSLPAGTISQRSLLLELRSSLPESAFNDQAYVEPLNEMANLNSRFMAHLDQVGAFESDARRASVRKQFSNTARLRELVFATESATTIHQAAREAAAHWRSSGDLDNVSSDAVTAFGLELFQSPTNNRWFATLLIVSE